MVTTARRRLGDKGEEIACEYLRRKGFEIVARNYMKSWGEIDIIATTAGVYHFVEVKTISREKGDRVANMTAEDHIHPAKIKRLVKTVEIYMGDVPGNTDYQIDVVTVELDTVNRKARCKLYEQVL